jgi:hypothetical protein
METPAPSSLLLSAVDAACQAAMHLKRSRKVPFTCLIVQAEREKQNYDIVPVYSTNYERSVEAAREQVAENHENLIFYIIVYDGTVAIEGASSDAIVIEAREVGQQGTFHFVRRYTPPGLFSKASAEQKLTLAAYEPLKKQND